MISSASRFCESPNYNSIYWREVRLLALVLRALIILRLRSQNGSSHSFRSWQADNKRLYPKLNYGIPLPNGMKLPAHRSLFESCASRTCDRSQFVVPKIAEAQECLFVATVSLGMLCTCKKAEATAVSLEEATTARRNPISRLGRLKSNLNISWYGHKV